MHYLIMEGREKGAGRKGERKRNFSILERKLCQLILPSKFMADGTQLELGGVVIGADLMVIIKS